MRGITKAICGLLPVFAGVGAAGVISNEMIDQVQPTVVEYISTAAGSLFITFATWLSQKLGIKVLEMINRNTVEMAAERFANSVIDMLQDRYNRSASPNIVDLVYDGVDYIKSGNPETVRQQGISDERLAVIVKGKLNKKAEGLLATTLTKPPVLPTRR